MLALTLFVIGIVCFGVSFSIVYIFCEKQLWDRQNYMSKINRLFERINVK